MSPVTFFRISLVLPIVLPLVALPFGMNAVAGILLIALTFGGAQYIAFALWLFFAIGRKQSSERIQKLSIISPLLFVPIQAVGWVAWGYYGRLSNPELVGIWEPLVVFAVYTLAVGYLYVGIVNLAFWVCKQKGIISECAVR
jgi:hypothetical protein